MNRGIGLVAYGDSDEENSDEDSPMTMAQTSETKETGMSDQFSFFNGKSTTSKKIVDDSQKTEGTIDSANKDAGRPMLKDTVSARSIINTRPIGNESLNKIASTNLMKQGLAASTENIQIDPTSEAVAIEGSGSSHSHSFIRSQSGTPLPADHSAAADVFNTPTGGRSPQVPSPGRVPIADESRAEDGSEDDKEDDESEVGSPGWHNKRAKLMKALLRPKPIPGVENFGIPPSPDGEVNPDVQAKMEQFHHVKVTRGIHFNQSLMKNKNFRNPHVYASLVEFVALNEIGSNFEKSEFFDFEGYGPESYASGLADAQKQALEKIAQQQAAARSQLQFVPGSTTTTTTTSAVGGGIGFPTVVVKPQQLPGSSRPPLSSSVNTAAPASVVSSNTQRNRKSKWDLSTDDPIGKKPRQ
ncbi:hypothetical protein BGX27_007516 [Mortierella sp. AM989]|nr:hypothetical protein BGX27_007516 [Mortierella sp. AM989]